MPDPKLHVLLIEDDVVDCEIVRRLLRDCVLLETPAGIQGVEAASSTQPDCVLLSTRLPDTDPLDVLEQIVTGTRFVPVVLVAGAGDEEVVRRGLASGALGFVSKSALTGVGLRAAIEIALQGASLRRDLVSARGELAQVAGRLVQDLGVPLRRIAEVSRDIRGRFTSRLDDQVGADLLFIETRALWMAAAVDDLAMHTRVPPVAPPAPARGR